MIYQLLMEYIYIIIYISLYIYIWIKAIIFHWPEKFGMIPLTDHDSSEGEQWGRDQIIQTTRSETWRHGEWRWTNGIWFWFSEPSAINYTPCAQWRAFKLQAQNSHKGVFQSLLLNYSTNFFFERIFTDHTSGFSSSLNYRGGPPWPSQLLIGCILVA